jgi:hypothetical protein
MYKGAVAAPFLYSKIVLVLVHGALFRVSRKSCSGRCAVKVARHLGGVNRSSKLLIQYSYLQLVSSTCPYSTYRHPYCTWMQIQTGKLVWEFSFSLHRLLPPLLIVVDNIEQRGSSSNAHEYESPRQESIGTQLSVRDRVRIIAVPTTSTLCGITITRGGASLQPGQFQGGRNNQGRGTTRQGARQRNEGLHIWDNNGNLKTK